MTAMTIQQPTISSDFKISTESIEGELEVEQLLNEIGMLPDTYDTAATKQEHDDKVSTVSVEEIETVNEDLTIGSSITPSVEVDILANPKSVETMETFSVPNPMAAFSVPNPIKAYNDVPTITVKAEPVVPSAVSATEQQKAETTAMKTNIVTSPIVNSCNKPEQIVIKIESKSTPPILPKVVTATTKQPSSPKSNKRKAESAAMSSSSSSSGSDSDDKELTEEEMEARR